MKLFRNIKRPLGTPVPTRGSPSQRDVWTRLLKVETKVLEWTDSGRLLQRDSNASAPALVLILGTNRVIPLSDLIERDVASNE